MTIIEMIFWAFILITFFVLQVHLLQRTWKLEKEVYQRFDEKDAIIKGITIQRNYLNRVAAKMQVDQYNDQYNNDKEKP